MKRMSLYIHIPFCIKKCAYCDFVSFPFSADAAKEYEEALFEELDMYSDILNEYSIKSIFVGGGTPSVMTVGFHERLLERIISGLRVESCSEITMEANPESIADKDIRALVDAGYNRLSIGMQSFDDVILDRIGRMHDSAQSMAAFELARKAGFENISVDLMYGLPGQSLEGWMKDVRIAACELSPEHISAYSLIVSQGTPMHRLIDESPGLFPGEEDDRKMHHSCTDFLAERGYGQYEISNYAKEGFESVHNKTYWERGEYMGLGVAAHSYAGGKRFRNTSDAAEYFKKLRHGECPVEETETLSEKDELFEEFFLGLRMNRGVSIERIGEKYHIDATSMFGERIQAMVTDGLVSYGNGHLALTRRGMDISNGVFLEFLKVIDQNY